MRIYLIRHGESTGDLDDRYGGDYDDHLSENGQEQARVLAEKLRNKNLQVIFHSPRIRTVETARAVFEVTRAPLEEIDEIRERNAYGVLTGLVKSEAQERFPEEVAELKRDLVYHEVQGSELYADFKERVLPALNELMAAKYDSIAIVTHGGPISCFVREVLGRELDRVGDCAVLELERAGSDVRLISLDNAELRE